MADVVRRLSAVSAAAAAAAIVYIVYRQRKRNRQNDATVSSKSMQNRPYFPGTDRSNEPCAKMIPQTHAIP